VVISPRAKVPDSPVGIGTAMLISFGLISGLAEYFRSSGSTSDGIRRLSCKENARREIHMADTLLDVGLPSVTVRHNKHLALSP